MIVGVSNVIQNGFGSGLNNLTVYSMKDSRYQPFFGFTESEVNHLLSDTLVNMDLVKKHYNGYVVPFRIRKCKRVPMSLFNPWSIVNFKETKKFDSFWMNISPALILKDLLQRTLDWSSMNEIVLETLTPSADIQHDMSYSEFESVNIHVIITFMFNIGFLTLDEDLSRLRVPNEEIRRVMISMLKEIIFPSNVILDHPYHYFQKEGKMDDFGHFLKQVMFQGYPFFDFNKNVQGSFYNVMMLTLWFSQSQDKFKVSPHVDSHLYGRERCDLIVYPSIIQDPSLPVVLFEFKKATGGSSTKELLRSNLLSSAQLALTQVSDKLYCYDVPGFCETMYDIGISFYQRDFFLFWNKRERVGSDHNKWSAPLESGSFCSLDVVS
jgi:predicted AAA-ATPase